MWPWSSLSNFARDFLQILVSAVLESRNANVVVAVFELLGLNRIDFDYVARDRNRKEIGDALAMDGQADFAALGTAHSLDRVGKGHALGKVVVDLDDLIARFEPGFVRGRTLESARRP